MVCTILKQDFGASRSLTDVLRRSYSGHNNFQALEDSELVPTAFASLDIRCLSSSTDHELLPLFMVTDAEMEPTPGQAGVMDTSVSKRRVDVLLL